ncbi:MAG: DMT family transporter [Candidatus Gracilibacteria bacterium]|jgi:drug/metabolite transporter (DMT)-like permease|nr:DMT family transporter [Candidatus Gracilibacteria bacterium]
MQKIYKKYFGELMLVLSSLSYSFEWYFIRNLGENGYTSLEITIGRSFLASTIIGLFFFIFNKDFFKTSHIKNKDWLFLLISGINVIIANLSFNTAIQKTSVANVLTIIYLSIFWGFILEILIFKESVNFKKILYIFLAFIGITLTLTKKNNGFSMQFGTGEALSIVLSLIMAISVVLNKKMIHILPLFRIFISYSIASFFIVLFLIQKNGLEYFSIFFNREFLIYTGLLTITSAIMGRGLKDLGTNYVPISTVLVIMLLEPIAQMTSAYFMADEKLLPINLIGVILTFSMVILISKKKEEKVAIKEPTN